MSAAASARDATSSSWISVRSSCCPKTFVIRPMVLKARGAHASLPKESTQQHRALLAAHAGENVRAMIESRMTEQVADRAGHPCLVVPRAEDHAIQTGEHDRTRAHGAGLERHVERAPTKVPRA